MKVLTRQSIMNEYNPDRICKMIQAFLDGECAYKMTSGDTVILGPQTIKCPVPQMK